MFDQFDEGSSRGPTDTPGPAQQPVEHTQARHPPFAASIRPSVCCVNTAQKEKVRYLVGAAQCDGPSAALSALLPGALLRGAGLRVQVRGRAARTKRFVHAHTPLLSCSRLRSPAHVSDDDTRLLLYALQQQATVGRNTTPRPWAWSLVESAKWSAWSQLGTVSSFEAMRLYVRTLEQAHGDWWALATRNGDAEATERVVVAARAASSASSTPLPAAPLRGSGGDAQVGLGLSALVSGAATGSWVDVPCTGDPPRPRYEHAACLVANRLLLLGGQRNGRALGDVHCLELGLGGGEGDNGEPGPSTPLAWRSPPFAAGGADPALPPRAGHVAVPLPGTHQVLLVGGHLLGAAAKRAATGAASSPMPAPMEVLSLDALSGAWSPMVTSGCAPAMRGGHSCAHVQSAGRLYIFGGEGAGRRLMGDMACLDLSSRRWEEVETRGVPPEPRSAHVSCAFGPFVYVFGGTLSSGHCCASLHVLDTVTCTWHAPAVSGCAPAPRAGCAAVVLGSSWFIAGGGDGTRPHGDTLALQLVAPPRASPGQEVLFPTLVWRRVAHAPPRSPLASEGLSLSAHQGMLIAACGYNGSYHAAIHVMRPDEAPAGAPSAPPLLMECRTPTKPGVSTPRASVVSQSPEGPAAAAAAAAAARVVELEGELRHVRVRLDAEQTRAVKAEAEAAELRQLLQAALLDAGEQAAESRRAQAALDKAEKARKGGLLAFVTG